MTRLATGIQGFDVMVQGGLPLGSSVVLQGPPGQEKLRFALTFVAEGLKAGASGLVVISSESPDAVLAELRSLGVDLEAVTAEQRLRIVDWYSWSEEKVADVEERGLVVRSSIDLTNLGVALSRAMAALSNRQSPRAVIEMLSPATNVYEVTQVYAFAQSAKKKFDRFGFTSLVLLEKDMHSASHLPTLHQPFDGVIEIERGRSGDRIQRKIGVLHLKETAADPTFRSLEITESGMRVVRESAAPSKASAPTPGAFLETQEERAQRLSLIMQIAGERLKVNPRDTDALFAIAAAQATLDDARGGLQSLERLAELDPNYPGLWVLKTKLHARLGEAERARESRQKGQQAEAAAETRSAESTVPCPMCEAPVAVDATTCGNCGVKFSPAAKLEDELEDLGRAAIQEMVQEEMEGGAPPTRSPPERKPAEPASKPIPKKGLTNGLVLDQSPRRPAGKTNGLRGRTNGLRGRTNGLTNGLRGRTNGLTNGLGRTNGLTNGLGRTNGLTNGLGRTNGLTNGLGRTNGLTNGLGAIRPAGFRSAGFRGMMQSAGWKLYVIPLVVVGLLLMPLFLVPEYNGPRTPIHIDGQFGDWTAVSTAAMESGSVPNPNADILRFGVVDNLGPQAFYVQVAGTALLGGGASPGIMDSVRIFVDTDRIATTGYRIDGLGADRMIEISGHGGAVRQSTLWEFDSNRDVRDWGGWIKGTSTPAAASGSQIEAEAEWLALDSTTLPFAAIVHAASWDGYTDAGEFPLGSDGGSLTIVADPQVPNMIDGSGVSLLRLTVLGHGHPVTFTSLQVQTVGTAPPTSALSLRLSDGVADLDQVTPTSRNVTFSFPPITLGEGAAATLSIFGDFSATGGETFGIRLPRTHPFGFGVEAVGLRENPGARIVGYLGTVPAGPRVDGAFAEWTSLRTDSVGDVGPRANPNIDLEREDAQSAGGSTYLFADVAGRILLGTPVPEAPRPTPVQTPSVPDTDRDTVPDSIDPWPVDFNNDGTPDAQTNADYDGDTILDYGIVGGTDLWLNTTLPITFPAPFGGRFVSVYIGPTERPPTFGEDVLRYFLDLDNSTLSGYAIGGIGADRLIEVRGKDGQVTLAALLTFSGSFPGQWAWTPVMPIAVALGHDALELSVPFNAARVVLEAGDFWGSADSTVAGPAYILPSFRVSSASVPLSVPWAQDGPQPLATVIDGGSNAIATIYNHQRKVVRAGDVSGQTACDATNSDGCWYVVLHDQLSETSANTAAATETLTTGYKVAGTFPTGIQSEDGTYIQYREAASGSAAYRSNTGSSGTSSPKTRAWDGASWAPEVEQSTASSPLRAVRMAYSPVSTTERIIVTLSDDGWLDAYVCTTSCTVTNNIGQVWSSAPSNPAIPFDIAYEQVSGDALLVYGVLSTDVTRDIAYKVYSGGSWGAEQYYDDAVETSDITYTVLKLASRPGSDQIGVVGAHPTPTIQGNALIWDGSALGSFQEIDASIQSASYEEIAIAWESNSGHLVAVAIDASVVRVSFREYTTSWSGYVQSIECAPGGSSARFVRLKANPLSTANDMILAMGGNGPRLGTCYWDGGTFVNGQTHDTAVDAFDPPTNRPFDFAWESTGSKGLLVYGTTQGQITYKTFTAPNTWGAATDAAMGTDYHPWVTLRTNLSPRTGATKILGVVLEYVTNDLGSIRWDGSTFAVVGAATLTSDTTVTTYESYDVQYQLTNSDLLDIRYDWTGVPAGTSYTLQVKGYREDEDINVQVLTPPSTWNTRITIAATTNTLYLYTLAAAEYNSGAPAIRFVDASGAVGLPSDFWVDYANIATTGSWDRVIVMRSADTAGSMWGSQIVLASGRPADAALLHPRDSAEPSIAIDSGGFLHVVWVSASASGDQTTLDRVRYARTTVAYPTQAQLASAANWAFEETTSHYPNTETVTTGAVCGGTFPADVQTSNNAYRCYREGIVDFGAIAYKSSTGSGVNFPKQLDRLGAAWGTPETELLTAGAAVENVRVIWDISASSSLFWIAVNTGANIHVYKCTDVDVCTKEDVDPSSGNDFAITQAVGAAPERHWDLEVEMGTGELLLAYDNPAAVADDFCYRTRTAGSGGSWSSETCFDHTSVVTQNPSFAYVVLASNPASDQIGFGAFDTTNDDFIVAVWDGTAWINANKAVSTTVTPTGGWGGTVLAEDSSDEFVAYSSNGADSVAECEWTLAGGWEVTCATFDADTSTGNDAKVISGASRAGADSALVCENSDNEDVDCWEWNGLSGTGGTRGTIVEHTSSDGSGTTTARPIGFDWNPDQSGTADGLAVYYDSNSGQLAYKTYDDSANSWSTESTFSSAGSHRWVEVIGVRSAAGAVKAIVLASNSNFDIFAYEWTGSGAPANEASITADTVDQTYPHWGLAFSASGSYRLDVRNDWSSIPTDGASYDLCVESYVAAAGGESMLVQVLTPPSTWNTRITVTKTADDNTEQCYTLTTAELNSGAPAIRWIGGTESGDATQSDLNIDLERVLRRSVISVDDANPGFMPTVSTDTSNNPHVAWSGSKTSGSVFYRNKAAGTWRATVSWGTTYTGLSVDVSPVNNYVSLVRYFESGTNEIQYMVCKDLSTTNCDVSAEFTKWDATAGVDTVATAVESGAYPSLVTTYEANGDLWIAYAKDVDGSTRAIYARFLDYPTNGFGTVETIDAFSGTQFTRPTIGVDKDGNVHALYVAIAGPQLYYNLRTLGWGSRVAVDSSSDHPSLMVRAPNDALYGTVSGAAYWKGTTSETYFYYIPEFEQVVPPILGVLSIVLFWARRSRRARKAADPKDLS